MIEQVDDSSGAIGDQLRYPGSKLYPDMAAARATMAVLYESGGRNADFVSFDRDRRHGAARVSAPPSRGC